MHVRPQVPIAHGSLRVAFRGIPPTPRLLRRRAQGGQVPAVEEADARASVRRVHPGVRPAEVGEAAVADLVAERHARRVAVPLAEDLSGRDRGVLLVGGWLAEAVPDDLVAGDGGVGGRGEDGQGQRREGRDECSACDEGHLGWTTIKSNASFDATGTILEAEARASVGRGKSCY